MSLLTALAALLLILASGVVVWALRWADGLLDSPSVRPVTPPRPAPVEDWRRAA